VSSSRAFAANLTVTNGSVLLLIHFINSQAGKEIAYLGSETW